MKHDKKSFKQIVDDMLHATGRHFQGIHVTCRICGTEAFAASLEVAQGFGNWTDIVHVQGPDYTGTCVDCRETTNRKEAPSGHLD